MFLLTILAVLFRHVFERLIDHDSYQARLQLSEIRHQQDLNDEKLMHQMNNNEQSNDQSDNSKDKTMELDEQPKIKGFKHKYQELQQTMAINNQDLKEIEAPIPQKKHQEEVAIA